jgi:wyosine [tRNA(Phe)-imidazoG37] synthetase (radical SAM superfamily)
LGRSLGVNNIPPKICSYACVYCQLGRTRDFRARPDRFYAPASIRSAVASKLAELRTQGEGIDYVAFVPDGEPTLDLRLGESIAALRPMKVKVAVISNGSLLQEDAVRKRLAGADWVSLKVDAGDVETWRSINRPHRSLRLTAVQAGIRAFARGFSGTLATETMLVREVNDRPRQLRAIAHFLRRIRPDRAYLAVPTRPPAESWVRPPSAEALARAYHLLSTDLDDVEYLIGYEGDAFASSGDPVHDLLSITAVHPMREAAVEALLDRCDADWSVLDRLIADGRVEAVRYGGHRFYLRTIGTTRGSNGSTASEHGIGAT